MSPTTIKDVAALAGVSIATASRVLTGNRATSEESRERVIQAAQDLNYRVNSRARSLRSARSQSIGVLVPDLRNPFFAELVYTIQTSLFEQGYSTLIGSANEDQVQQDQYLSDLLSQQVDGLILAPQGRESALLPDLVSQGLPMVFVDRVVEGLEVPSVESDPATGLREALGSLAAQGIVRVGFVSGPLNTSTGHDRLDQFVAVAHELFGPGRFDTVEGGYDRATMLAGVDSMISNGAQALIFGYSPNTLDALRHFHFLGLHVGHDLAVISFDDIPTFTLVDPQISVINQHVHHMGRASVDILTDLLGGETPPSTRLPTTYIERSSSTASAREHGS